jgi:hypothetical protein
VRALRAVVPVGIKQHRWTQSLRRWLWFRARLRPRLRRELSRRSEGSVRAVPSAGPRILVPIIETSHYQHFQILILAKALQARGAQVKVLVCGQTLDGCEIKSVRTEETKDPCATCRFNEHSVHPLFGLEILRLRDVVSPTEHEALRREARRLVETGTEPVVRDGTDITRSIADSVTRYYYGGISQDAAAVRRVRTDQTTSALLSLEVARRIEATWKPDVVLSHMYCYSPWEPYFLHYRKQGARFVSLSITPFDYNSVILNSFELSESSRRFERYAQSRQSAALDEREKTLLQKFVSNRTSGAARVFREYGFFDDSGDLAAIREQLRFDPAKRNIFLFSNVFWDVGMTSSAALFQDVLDWVLETVAIVANEPSCHLYVKPHPGEVYDSSNSLKGVAQVLRERYPVLPPNVTIIEPAWKINTYRLFPLIDVGVIFNGTLGLEMMLSGIPVISTGRTTHLGLGLANEPDSMAAYRAALLGTSAPVKVDRERLELFAYFYFIRTLIPWHLTNQAFADRFEGFRIRSLEDLEPGRDPVLDHLCDCILDADALPEGWPEEPPPQVAQDRAILAATL